MTQDHTRRKAQIQNLIEVYLRDALIAAALSPFLAGRMGYADALEAAVVALSNDRSRLLEELMKAKAKQWATELVCGGCGRSLSDQVKEMDEERLVVVSEVQPCETCYNTWLHADDLPHHPPPDNPMGPFDV